MLNYTQCAILFLLKSLSARSPLFHASFILYTLRGTSFFTMFAAQDLLQDKVDTCRQQVRQGVFNGPQGSTTQVCPIADWRTFPHFDAGTIFGRITVARRSLATKQARALTNFFVATYNYNPHLSAFSVAFPGLDMDDLLEGLAAQGGSQAGLWCCGG